MDNPQEHITKKDDSSLPPLPDFFLELGPNNDDEERTILTLWALLLALWICYQCPSSTIGGLIWILIADFALTNTMKSAKDGFV
jgi:hypothetical protein